MKNKINLKEGATAIGILVCLLLLNACSKSGVTPPTPVEKNTQLLAANTWKVQSVQADGVDKTASFTGMTLKFTSSGYTSVSGNLVWPVTGIWLFTDATATAFTREDGVLVTIKDLSATTLQVSLTWTKTTLGPGRVNSTAGQYVFSFLN